MCSCFFCRLSPTTISNCKAWLSVVAPLTCLCPCLVLIPFSKIFPAVCLVFCLFLPAVCLTGYKHTHVACRQMQHKCQQPLVQLKRTMFCWMSQHRRDNFEMPQTLNASPSRRQQELVRSSVVPSACAPPYQMSPPASPCFSRFENFPSKHERNAFFLSFSVFFLLEQGHIVEKSREGGREERGE